MSSRRRGWGGCTVALLVAAVLIALFALYAYLSHDSSAQPDDWGAAVQREWEPPDTDLPDLTARVREKQGINSDAVGWLYIPDTGIDLPVLQVPDQSDMVNKYLDTTFEGEKSKRGACFASMRANFGAGGRNDLAPMTTLYAHSYSENPSDNSLFSPLKYYRDEAFARAHPYVYFSTWQENMAFEVVAVFEAHVNLPYNHTDQSVSDFEATLDAISQSSLYDYGAEIVQTDRLLILSTCAMTVQGHKNLDPYTTQYRFVVMSRLIPPGEVTDMQAEFTVNPNPMPPDNFLHMGSNW